MTIPAAEYHERQEALLGACADLGLDAVVVFANGGCFGLSGVSQGHMGFLGGWDSFDSPSALVLRQGRAPFLLVAHHRMKLMARDRVSGAEIDWIDQDSFGDGVARALAAGGRAPRRIGICGWEDVVARSWKSVEAALSGAELVDVKERLAPLRAVKSPAQLALHRRVAAICDGMFEALARMPVAGRPAYEIKAELECHARRRGCEFVQHWMTVGPAPDYPRYYPHENRQVARTGDILLYGMMMTMDGVWGHAVRCFRVGAPPDARHARIQEAVVRFQRDVVALMRPGQDLAAAVAAGLDLAATVRAEIGDPDARMLRLGHALGYSYTEPGISEAFPRSFYPADDERGRSRSVILKPGMVFEVHPIFFYADGAAGVGDMVEIVEKGPAFVTGTRRDVITIPV